jgi:hypothetical protein
MREREDRTLPFAFRSEEMSLPTIREHVAPNSTIGRDLMARIFRGLDTGRVSQLWGDVVVKVVGCLARVVVELFEGRLMPLNLSGGYQQSFRLSQAPLARQADHPW